MGYDIGTIIGSILGGIFPITFVLGIVFLGFKMQKRFFKDLFAKFQTEERVPAGSVRTEVFQYGNKVKVQNSAKIAERQDAFFIKFPMNKAIKIPFTAIRRVKLKDGLFKAKIITLNFADESLQPVHITIKADKLGKFPQLLKGIDEEAATEGMNEFEKAALETSKQFVNKDGELDLGKIKQAVVASNPKMVKDIKNTASNVLRGLATIVLIIVGIAVLIAYYG